jgi:vacuolar-type H+-ATPase subunit H
LVDVQDLLRDLTKMIESARAMPMSASCIINRGEALRLINRLRESLPQEFHQAQILLRDREAMIEEVRREAEHVIAAAHEERNRILSTAPPDPFPGTHEDLYAKSAAIRQEANEYVDQQLANLEMILSKALASVQHGRDRLRLPEREQPPVPSQPGFPPGYHVEDPWSRSDGFGTPEGLR